MKKIQKTGRTEANESKNNVTDRSDKWGLSPHRWG